MNILLPKYQHTNSVILSGEFGLKQIQDRVRSNGPIKFTHDEPINILIFIGQAKCQFYYKLEKYFPNMNIVTMKTRSLI